MFPYRFMLNHVGLEKQAGGKKRRDIRKSKQTAAAKGNKNRRNISLYIYLYVSV